MTKRRATPTLLVAIAALLSGCQEPSTAPSVPEGLDPQLAKGGSQGPDQTVTFTFRSSDFSTGTDFIIGDGRITNGDGGTTYIGDECGVGTAIPPYNGDAGLNTRSSKIKPSEEAACGGREGRYFEVSFDDRLDDGPDLDWDDRSVQAKWMSIDNVLSIPKDETRARQMRIWFDDQHLGGYGWAEACPWGLAYGWPATLASFVQVTRLEQQTAGDDVDAWLVEAVHDAELPDGDVAVCLGGKSEPVVLGYYHVPFELTLICEGEC